MRIERLRVYRYSLLLRDPLVLKGSALTRRDGLLVEVVTEVGASGWGEIAPLPGFSRESLAEAEQKVLALRQVLAGQDVNFAARELAGNAGLPSVQFGLGLALSEARREVEGVPPEAGAAQGFVSVNALLISGDAAAARTLAEAGYRAIKLKVGRAAIEADIRMVREVMEAVGKEVRVRLDANRSWTFEDALEFVSGVGDLPYEYIEEPLADAGRLQEFVELTGAPVALDESLAGISPGGLAGHSYAAAVVLKPTLLGSLSMTAEYGRQALALGMKPVISAAYESGVGIRAMARLASTPDFAGIAVGLDTYRQLAEDVWEPPLVLKDGGFSVADLLHERRRIRRELLSEVR